MASSSPSSSSPPNTLDLRVVVEIPLRQFISWLAIVLLVTWNGYPGVVCVTPLAWLIALRVGIVCVTRSASASPTRRVQEAALAGAWFAFLQGVLFWIIIRMAPIQASEQMSVTLISLGMMVMGILVGAGLAAFTASQVERRRRAAKSGHDPVFPKLSDFPPGTKFVVKEFDVPLVWIPGQGWFNWFGGTPRPYDVSFLKVDNNWPADSFEAWLEIVKESLKAK
jgi:hypothetical protein